MRIELTTLPYHATVTWRNTARIRLVRHGPVGTSRYPSGTLGIKAKREEAKKKAGNSTLLSIWTISPPDEKSERESLFADIVNDLDNKARSAGAAWSILDGPAHSALP